LRLLRAHPTMKTLAKICGITNRTDADTVYRAGADFIGVIVAVAGSPRSVSVAIAAEIIAAARLPVVLLMDSAPHALIAAARDLAPHAMQLVGAYSLAQLQAISKAVSCALWLTVRIPCVDPCQSTFTDLLKHVKRCQESGVAAIVLDTLTDTNCKGGTGKVCDWHTAARLVSAAPLPMFLAGGLTPDNVGAAIAAVKPYGIDLSSGVEQRPGVKDPAKVVALMRQVRAAGAT